MLKRSDIVTALNATLVSTCVSLLVTFVLMKLLMGMWRPEGLIIAAVAPICIAFPVTLYIQRQRGELVRIHDELQRAHRDLTIASQFDELTQIYNRSAFYRHAQQRLDEGTALSMLLIDVDKFKSINDQYGHQSGDKALSLIADAIQGAIRITDFVGRLGGEEFCVCCPNVASDQAYQIAERVRLAVSRIDFAPVLGVHHMLTVSVGVAQSRPDATLDALLKQADQRMYRAKHQGRNQVVFEDKADARIA